RGGLSPPDWSPAGRGDCPQPRGALDSAHVLAGAPEYHPRRGGTDMSIRFYSWPRSSGSRVHWALEELGVPYEHVVLDGAKGEHRAPAYPAINPSGKAPGLVARGPPIFR